MVGAGQPERATPMQRAIGTMLVAAAWAGCAGDDTTGRAAEALSHTIIEASVPRPALLRGLAFRGDLMAISDDSGLEAWERGPTGWSRIDRVVGATFGAVALSGETLVVEDVSADAVGVFVRVPTGLVLEARLVAPPPPPTQVFGGFGQTFAIDGDFVVVGAPRSERFDAEEGRWHRGAYFVYQRTDGIWRESFWQYGCLGLPGEGIGQMVGVGGGTVVAGRNTSCDEASGFTGAHLSTPPPSGSRGGCGPTPCESPDV